MEKTIKITVTVEERWIPYLATFLKKMEHFGSDGHSAWLAFYSDGDGDFRPRFEFKENYPEKQPIKEKEKVEVEYGYDAG